MLLNNIGLMATTVLHYLMTDDFLSVWSRNEVRSIYSGKLILVKYHVDPTTWNKNNQYNGELYPSDVG